MNKIFIRSILVFVVFSIVLFSLLKGQMSFYAVKDIIGLDQSLYMHVSMFFTDEIFEQSYNGYQLQRIFPFALVNILFESLSIPCSGPNLMFALIVCNVFALVVSIILFFRISNYLHWKISTEIIAFSILFVNFHTLKYMEYTPFNTDEFAFLSSIIMLAAFYRKRHVLLLCAGVIGTFIWPTLFISALILYLFKQSPISLMDKCNSHFFFLWHWVKLGVALLVLPILVLTFIKYAPAKTLNGFADIYRGDWFGYNYINISVTAIATLCLMFFVYKMLEPFQFNLIYFWKKIVESVTFKRFVIVCFVYGAMRILFWSLSNDDPYWDMAGMLKHTALRSTALPFVFLEAHFLYFGLIVVLLIFNWKRAIAVYERLGIGFMLIISMCLILCVNPESRYMIYLLPFVAIPFMAIVDQMKLRTWVPWLFLCMQLLISRFWLPVNQDWLLRYFRFDVTHYSMNGLVNGAFQHVEMYIVGSVLFILISIIYYWGVRKSYFFNK